LSGAQQEEDGKDQNEHDCMHNWKNGMNRKMMEMIKKNIITTMNQMCSLKKKDKHEEDGKDQNEHNQMHK
jgi:hypothetical protein